MWNKKMLLVIAIILSINCAYALIDTNWQNTWGLFDANMKPQFQLINENTLHWHDTKYYTRTQCDSNWNKYTLINADINFRQLQNYPPGCPNGYAIQDMNDTNFTCITVGASGNDTNWQTNFPLFDANIRTTFESMGKNQYYSFFDDFDGMITGKYWTPVNSGANSGQSFIDSASGENTYGVVAITKGTTGSGKAALIRGTGSILLGRGRVILITKIKIPTAPGTNQQFNIQMGLHDDTTTNAVDGVYFVYAPKDTGDARINCVTSNNSTRTTTNSGVLMTTNWNTYKIDINATGGEAKFYINQTLVCTHTTNIPTGAGRVTGPRLQILNNGGSNAESFYVDFFSEQINFNNAR